MVLDDQLALNKFNYNRFINDVQVKLLESGFNYKTDECLQNFYQVLQGKMFYEIFEAYQHAASPETYASIYTDYLKKYKNELSVFSSSESVFRNEFQRRKNSSLPTAGSLSRGGSGPSTTAGCTNMDFEAGNTSGWTSTSSAGKVAAVSIPGTDPSVPAINTTFSMGVVPPGLTNVGFSAVLDAMAGGNSEWLQMEQNFTVTSANEKFIFYVALVMNQGGHACGINPRFEVDIRNSLGATIPCSSIDLISSGAGGSPCSAYTGWATSGGFEYLDWSPVVVPLSAYIGQNVTISMRVTRCGGGGGHGIRAYIESSCNPIGLLATGSTICSGRAVDVYAPFLPGFDYAWTSSTGFTSTSYSIAPLLGGTYSVTIINPTSGCSVSLDTALVAVPSPTANFNYSVTPCSPSVSIPVISTSSAAPTDPIATYSWDWGDATPLGGGTSGTHAYASSGTKTIELTVVSTEGCSDVISKTFNLTVLPVANFSATSVCQSTATAFTDLSTTPAGVINAWSWDFTNNGSADNLTQNPTFTYPSSGTFTAALTVTNSDLCTSTKTLVVDVWGHSIPNFSPNGVCYGTATTFSNSTDFVTNANVGGVPNYTWNFADATATVSTTDPSHTYVLGGNVNATYNVTLTATSSHGCVDNIVKPVNVYATPTASFTSDEVCFGSQTHLLDASNGNGNALSGYVWDFSSNGTVDITGVPNPNFTFPSVGNNPVTYTVFTNPSPGLLCSNVTSTINVWVNPGPNPNFTFVNNCVNAQPNSFDASSSTISIGTNTAYAWAYGDAGSGSGAATTHTYALASTYNVTLTVTSDKGCVASVVKPVEVYEKPMATILNSNACDQKAMTFTASTLPGSGTITIWSWDYNNTIATLEALGQNSSFIFPAAGSQTVNMIAETNHGCKETFTKVVYVDYVPVPLFSVNTPSGCPTHCVTFSDNTLPITAPGVNADWKWVFGDGSTLSAATGANQIHCYQNTTSNQVNQFDVKLVVTTNKGCSDSLLKTNFITVFPKPIADFTVSPNPGSIVTPLESFTNESIDYTSWIWEFGDNTAKDSINRNPTHVYDSPNAQDYVSYLIVSNQYGCKDTAVAKVELQPDFVFYIPNAFTPENQDGLNDVFTGNGIGIAKYEMWIFDRWGSSIYYSDDIRKGWNGKVQSKEKDCPQDVYIWKVKLVDVLGKKHDYVGHVTLVK